MSAPAETAPAAAPVEEVKPTETPAAEPAPVEEPKVEEAAAPAPAAEASKEEVKPEVCLMLSRARQQGASRRQASDTVLRDRNPPPLPLRLLPPRLLLSPPRLPRPLLRPSL